MCAGRVEVGVCIAMDVRWGCQGVCVCIAIDVCWECRPDVCIAMGSGI